MSNTSTPTSHVPSHTSDGHSATDPRAGGRRLEARRISTETKAAFKTTELVAYVVAVIAVLIASAVVDASDFGPQEAWRYVTFLTIGYMVSRGLAKSGSREHYNDQDGTNSGR